MRVVTVYYRIMSTRTLALRTAYFFTHLRRVLYKQQNYFISFTFLQNMYIVQSYGNRASVLN